MVKYLRDSGDVMAGITACSKILWMGDINNTRKWLKQFQSYGGKITFMPERREFWCMIFSVREAECEVMILAPKKETSTINWEQHMEITALYPIEHKLVGDFTHDVAGMKVKLTKDYEVFTGIIEGLRGAGFSPEEWCAGSLPKSISDIWNDDLEHHDMQMPMAPRITAAPAPAMGDTPSESSYRTSNRNSDDSCASQDTVLRSGPSPALRTPSPLRTRESSPDQGTTEPAQIHRKWPPRVGDAVVFRAVGGASVGATITEVDELRPPVRYRCEWTFEGSTVFQWADGCQILSLIRKANE